MCPSIDYKPPLLSINEKDNENMTQVKTSGKNGKINDPNRHGEPNSPNIPVLNEYLFIGVMFLLTSQEDGVNISRDKIPGKTGENNEPNKLGEPNSPKMSLFI